MRKVMVLLSLLLFMSACAPDPKREAEAFAIRTEAEQQALNQEQAREHAEQMNAITEQDARIVVEHKAATAQEWRDGLNRFIRVSFMFVMVFAGVFMFYGTRTMIVSFDIAAKGLAEASARRAMLSANLIHLDPKTRQFPLVMQYLGKGCYSLADPNTDAVLMLDTRNASDRQKISTSGLTQLAGAVAQEARQSSDPAGIAVMQPPVVSARDEMITVGGER